MAQPYRGRTVVEIVHPSQDISWRSPTSLSEVVSRLFAGINAGATGMYADTVVTVEQGGVQAYGTVTLVDVGGAAAQGAYSFASASGTTTATVNGVAFSQTTGTDSARAIALAAAINASEDPLIDDVVTALAAGTDVDLTSVRKGVVGNAITTTATGTGLTAGAATLQLGADGEVTLTVGGTAVVTNTTDMTDAEAATAVAAAVVANTTVDDLATATAATNVVTVTANDYSPAGNLITLTTATDTGTATTGHLSGGKLSGGTYPTSNTLRRP
jgi:hypothetical protein